MAETTTATPAEIRAWAKDKGYNIGDRGRISQVIKDAYAEYNAV